MSKTAQELLYELKHDKEHVFLLLFYRSDCPYTQPTKEAMKIFLEWLKTDHPNVKVYSIMDGAIQVFREALGITRTEMPTVPSAVVYYRGSRRWFLARRAPTSVQMQHFVELLDSLLPRLEERTAGSDPVFLTYYFNRRLRHDPIHMTIVGALMLLQQIRHTPIRFQPSNDMNMHGVLSVHGNVNKTFKGHAAADYLALLLEVNQRLGFGTENHHRNHNRKKHTNRAGGSGAELERQGGDATWADYLTGFTVVAAMLA